MTELETRMRAMLEKTGLYFGEDKWLSAELAAYAKGLELVYDTLFSCAARRVCADGGGGRAESV